MYFEATPMSYFTPLGSQEMVIRWIEEQFVIKEDMVKLLRKIITAIMLTKSIPSPRLFPSLAIRRENSPSETIATPEKMAPFPVV